jgi:hypothetical protein
MAINGAMVGSLGPSLEVLGRTVNLGDAVLARLVLQNRLCKLAGTLIWWAYANQLQKPQNVGRPHSVFGGLMLLTASCAVTVGATTHATALQLALVCYGVAYGISDSGVTCTQLLPCRPPDPSAALHCAHNALPRVFRLSQH